jgi:hypothetical protein
VSADGGRSWREARLGPDYGRYSFRRWTAAVPIVGRGPVRLMVRCWNTVGEAQPLDPIWNPSGYARDHVEVTTAVVT